MKSFFLAFKQRFSKECLAILRLAGPIVVAQLTITGMSFVDTIMAGSVSPKDLAAVAVASSFFNPVILFIQGILMAVTPLVAYQIGAKQTHKSGNIFRQALVISLLLAALAWGLLWLAPSVFNLMEVEAGLVSLTKQYLFYVCFGLPAFAVYQVLRGVNEARSNIKAIMIIGVIGLLVNIPVNYIFIHGLFGMPQLGGAGCGVATAAVNWFMAIAMSVYLAKSRSIAPLCLFSGPLRLDYPLIKRIFSLGLPIGGAIFFEVTLFSLIALLLSPLGADIVAAHQIALNFTSMVFMLPLSIGIALTIRVGNFMGEKSSNKAQISAYSGIILVTFITFFIAAATVLFRMQIIGLYTSNQAVAAIAAPLFLLAATYQLSDSLQVCCAGALRGYQDTRYIFLVTLISFWPIGLGIGTILTFTDYLSAEPMGVQGFWIAIVLALTACALGLMSRLIWASNNPHKLQFINKEA
ncbi:MATE family efflux transporter [Agarivorans gilvus]|uniref:MATE family efflux transporter n=1 Tax=Agarivorans gilvus TaxID=680279 RepID=UPI0006EC10DD|nr:MATE family efflux transporter [Agarivorans gilvus]